MAEENTHGMCVAGTGIAAAGDTAFGPLTLPAEGPWEIHQVWGYVARAAATAAELIGGHIRIESVAGDLEPNPAPAKYPVFESGSFLGATASVSVCPLAIYDIAFTAPGKSQLMLIYHQSLACTVAPEIVLGIIFGKSRAEKKPLIFSEVAHAVVAAATDTAVGTLTLSEKSTRISGICAVCMQDGVLTTAESLLGFVRLASDDVNIIPAQFPFQAAYGAGVGALIGSGSSPPISYIPIDIPVPGGARINSFVDLNNAVTNPADVEIFLAYE